MSAGEGERLCRFGGDQCDVGEGAEGVDDSRVELAAFEAFDLGDRGFEWPGLLVGALVEEGVEDVSDGDDPGWKRDLLAAECVRVAASVPPFVVGAGDLLGHLENGGLA